MKSPTVSDVEKKITETIKIDGGLNVDKPKARTHGRKSDEAAVKFIAERPCVLRFTEQPDPVFKEYTVSIEKPTLFVTLAVETDKDGTTTTYYVDDPVKNYKVKKDARLGGPNEIVAP